MPTDQPAQCCAKSCASSLIPPTPFNSVLAPNAENAHDGSMHTRLSITEMDCPTEESLIRGKLSGMPGIFAVNFNLMQRILTVTHAPNSETLDALLAAIAALGFTPELLKDDADASGVQPPSASVSAPKTSKSHGRLLVAGLAAAAAEAVAWLAWPSALAALLALVAVLLCGLTTYKKGWIALKNFNLNINALMCIAITGAFLIGQWAEAAMVMVLFTLAEMIEARSLDRARQAIKNLLQLSPEQATVRQSDGAWQSVLAKDVRVGEVVRIRPGECIPLDGLILSGQSTLNQAAITGESLPVEKSVGESVFAGTLNESGSFEYQVSSRASESTLARIIHAVEAAQSARAPIQRFVDRFAKIYTPCVFAVAFLVAIVPPLLLGSVWTEAIYQALVLLVIACPCALVISTPVTVVSGLAAAAKQGILIKGGAYLEEGRKLRCLFLDKTGTLTQGKPKQTDFLVWDEPLALDAQALALRTRQIRQWALSLASRSDHPVSRALVADQSAAAQHEPLSLLEVIDFSALPGKGVQGKIDGQMYCLGNQRLLREQNLCSSALVAQLKRFEEQGKSAVCLSNGKSVLALFAVADTVKESSRAALSELRLLGVKSIMLSGDNQRTAHTIAQQVGLDEAYGDLLPEDKLNMIEREIATRQGSSKVGMVGDGINDAPALARADIGFAMGAAGTGVAIETADVVLMDDDLRKLARFIRLSRRTHTILWQNISLALGIKALFLILTLSGLGSMWMAVFADVGASLLVIGNGLRVLQGEKLREKTSKSPI